MLILSPILVYQKKTMNNQTPKHQEKALSLAVFGGGCFWCTEAVFQQLRGVGKVTSGYAGGKIPNPSYERVSVGTTGY